MLKKMPDRAVDTCEAHEARATPESCAGRSWLLAAAGCAFAVLRHTMHLHSRSRNGPCLAELDTCTVDSVVEDW